MNKREFRAKHKIVCARLLKFEQVLGDVSLQSQAFEFLKTKWPELQPREIAFKVGELSDSACYALEEEILADRAELEARSMPAAGHFSTEVMPDGVKVTSENVAF